MWKKNMIDMRMMVMFMFSAKLGSNPALSTVEHKENETQ
jgi:hypothetical protein